MSLKVLILGANGFIGSSLTRAILWAGAIAATAAIAEVAIYRIVNAVGEKKFPA